MEVFPAFVEERRKGCVFRAAGGLNFRNSSVTVHDPARFDLEWLVKETHSFSREHGIAPVIRVPQLWPEFERELDEAGWHLFRSCAVLDRSLEDRTLESPDMLVKVDRDHWLDFQLGKRALEPEKAKTLRKILDMLPDDAERLAWREDGKELGGTLLWYDGSYCALMNMLVSPDARGTGVGKRFLSGLLDHAAASGSRTMWLQVLLENTPAVSLYERAGFKRVYDYAYYRQEV